jgi:RsiW-degrading membrane proteinase PrsW (M82 family)
LQLLTPLQNAYFGMAFDPRAASSSIYIVLLGSAFLFALVEELTKFVCVFLRSLLKMGHNLRLGIALGVACGAGFALMQAANLLAFTPSGAAAVPADLVQKFLSIGLNTATGALIGFLIIARWPWAFYLIPIGIKTLFNWLPFFVQKGSLRPASYSLLTFVLTALTLVALYLLYRRAQPLKSSGRIETSR